LYAFVSHFPHFILSFSALYSFAEFDNPDFNYASDPKAYRDAFRYLVDKCHKHSSCRSRVITVWHSWAAGLPGGTKLGNFYPGDDVVDWVGVSVFQQFYPNKVGGSVRDLQHVLEFASKHDKPTMIAESTPFGGNHNNTIIILIIILH
jgi:beta-mannanase